MAVNNQFPIPEAPQVPTFSEYKPYEKPFPEADIPTLGAYHHFLKWEKYLLINPLLNNIR
ncbi:hypothetical protein LCGC14_2367140 [marine sediment metagenome]|uniref:Uncharacterized protein n=1 Tax=marine sediment metagenome TaxID=412755 RepID=A0A0F9EZP6_9ZZZZ